jgi:hypothetical protein
MPEPLKEKEFNDMMEQQRIMKNSAVTQDQYRSGSGQPNNPFTGSGNQITPEQQAVLNEVKTNVITAASPVITPAAPSQGQCPQCNLFHPPLAPGEKCPNAPIKVDGISDAQVNEIVVKVKDILASQMEQKGVKSFEKFTGGLIVELMNYCEGYKE